VRVRLAPLVKRRRVAVHPRHPCALVALALAGSAPSRAPRVYVSQFCVGMPLRAVCDKNAGIVALGMLERSDQLQVLGIHTPAYSAFVVNLATPGNRTDRVRIAEPVSTVEMAANSQNAIPPRQRTRPFPTGGRLFDFRPELGREHSSYCTRLSTWRTTPQGRAGLSAYDPVAATAAANWMLSVGRAREWDAVRFYGC
jgi:hypothetical protein